MKITIINDYIEPVGGVEIYNEILRSLLKSRGHKVQLIGGSIPRNKYYQFFQSIYSYKYQKKIFDKVDDFSPDIVIAHSMYYNISPSFLSKIYGETPIIHILPNVVALKYESRKEISPPYLFLAWLRTFIHRYCLRRWVDVYIAPSETAKAHLEAEIGTTDVVKIPFPIYWDIADKPTNPNTAQLLFVGRLDDIKGVDVLIRSLSLLSDNINLDIVGEGPMDPILRTLVTELNLESQVQFRGYIPHKELREEYRNATISILPSTIEENSPLVIRESLSQGTPVITTDFGGQKELIEGGKCGLLVSPNDELELASAIEQIVNNNTLHKELSENALEYSQRFSKEKYVNDIEKLLRMVLDSYSN